MVILSGSGVTVSGGSAFLQLLLLWLLLHNFIGYWELEFDLLADNHHGYRDPEQTMDNGHEHERSLRHPGT